MWVKSKRVRKNNHGGNLKMDRFSGKTDTAEGEEWRGKQKGWRIAERDSDRWDTENRKEVSET